MTETLAARWEAYSDAGRRCFAEKQYDRAEEAFLAALRAAEHFGDEDQRLAQSLNNLARVYGRREKYFPAAALLHRLLGIQERTMGEMHPGLVGVLTNLAEMYARLGDAAQELVLRQRALDLRLAFGESSDQVLGPMRQRIDELARRAAEGRAGGARASSGDAPRVRTPQGSTTAARPAIAPETPAGSAAGIEAALIWPEPKPHAAEPAPEQRQPTPRAAVTPAAPPVRLPEPEPRQAVRQVALAPLAPPLPTPLVSRAVLDDVATEPEPDADYETRSWNAASLLERYRKPAIAAAAVLLLAVVAFAGRGAIGDARRAEAASQASATGSVSTEGVTEEEQLQVGLAAAKGNAAPAPVSRLTVSVPPPVSSSRAEREEARRDAERAEEPAQPETRRSRGDSSSPIAVPRISLSDVTASIDRTARAKVDSMTRASQLREPTFKRPARIP